MFNGQSKLLLRTGVLSFRHCETHVFLTPKKNTSNHVVDMSKSPNKPRLPLSHRFCARNAAEKDLWLRAVSNVKALVG